MIPRPRLMRSTALTAALTIFLAMPAAAADPLDAAFRDVPGRRLSVLSGSSFLACVACLAASCCFSAIRKRTSKASAVFLRRAIV